MIAARRVLGTMAVAGAPVTPSGPTLAIDDGFGAVAGSTLAGTAPDTVGSPAVWQTVIASIGGLQLRRDGAGSCILGGDTNSSALIPHGSDIAECQAEALIGQLSADRWAGLMVAQDPAASSILRGGYTVLLHQTAAGVQSMLLLYSPNISTAATTVASQTTTFGLTAQEVKAVIEGGAIKCYHNGALLIDYAATIPAGWRQYGGVVLRSVGGSTRSSIDRYRGWV